MKYNLYRSTVPEEDLLTDAAIQLNYRFPKLNINIDYQGDWFFYRDYTVRNFILNHIGLDYYKSFGKDNRQAFYLGTDCQLRLNEEEYDIYNYTQLYGYANFHFDLAWMFVKTGYNFRHRGYANLSDLSNNRHFIFLQLNKSFATRTTLIIESNIGRKSFSGNEIIATTTTQRGGKGKGKMSGMYNQTVTTSSVQEVPALSQAVVLMRVAQSLHTKMGIYVQYRQQVSLTNETEFINSDRYYQDEELFDDPFSYESKHYSAQLTWMLPASMKLQIKGGRSSKKYISDQAYTSAQDTAGIGGRRIDAYGHVALNFSKDFMINKKGLKSLRFLFYFNYIDNKSNSYWYDYKNTIWGSGITWRF